MTKYNKHNEMLVKDEMMKVPKLLYFHSKLAKLKVKNTALKTYF
jgi:hypothetical protein